MAMFTTPVTGAVIGCAIRIHKSLGPGLLESAYEFCLAHELRKQGLSYESQVPLPLVYDGVTLPCVYRADFIVEDMLLLELKVLERIMPVHHAQVLTYVRLAHVRQALLINFNVPILKYGIKSFLGSTGAEGTGGVEDREQQ
jgi:GxxExxY protein